MVALLLNEGPSFPSNRRTHGWTIRETAPLLGMDEGTWGDWEQDKTILLKKHRVVIARLLGLPQETVHQIMAARWSQGHSLGYDIVMKSSID